MPLDYTGVGAAQFDEPATLVWGTPIPVGVATVLELSLRVALISGTESAYLAGLICYNQSGVETGQRLTISGSVTGSDWEEIVEEFSSWPGGTSHVRMVFQHHTENSTLQVDEFSFEETTSLVAAASSLISAQSAQASSSDAGNFAAATQSERLLAETAVGNAVVAQNNAVQAQETAEGASAIAISAKETAVQIAGNVDAGIDAIAATVSTLETAVVDVQGNASAGYLIRAQAGDSLSLLDLVAADGSAGAVSLARLSADAIILDGSITAGHLSATSMQVAGLSIFDDRLQSNNFVTDVSGWMIDDNGSMELNNLVVRESVVVGAVSNGVTYASSAAVRLGNGGNVPVPTIGPMELGQFFQIAVLIEWGPSYRHYYTYFHEKAEEQRSTSTYGETHVSLQSREMVGGVWSAWGTEVATGWSGLSFSKHESVFSKHGVFEDVELRFYVNTRVGHSSVGNGTHNYVTYDNIRSTAAVGRALVR